MATRFHVGLVLAFAVLAVAACTSATSPKQLVAPGAATPLRTEPPELAPATPKATPTPKPAATVSGSYYKPPGWDDRSDVDCADFDTQAHAESFFKGTGGTTSHDPYHLDSNHDGVACESLP